MGFVGDGAVELPQLIEVVTKIRGGKERSELSIDHQGANQYEAEDEKDRDDGDKDVSNNQPPAQAPQHALPEEPHQADQVVEAGGQKRDPEQDPQEAGRCASEPVDKPQGSAVRRDPEGETPHPAAAIFLAEGFEYGAEHGGWRLGTLARRGRALSFAFRRPEPEPTPASGRGCGVFRNQSTPACQ